MYYNYKTKSEGKLYKIVDDAIKEYGKKSRKKSPCVYGVKKSGGCKKKPGSKKSSRKSSIV